jgi:peptidoglycan/xylan/chitin deacetylase (PgdA/CDA1 family)
MYHSVDSRSQDYLTVSQNQFREQMEYLSESYNLIQLRDVIHANEPSPSFPDNPAVVSFDDSLKDNLDYAIPVLEEYHIKAVFFVIAGYLGGNNLWDHKAYKISDHMSPDDLLYLHHHGHEIGNHSLSHQRLTKLPDHDLKKEFIQSNQMLTEIIGNKPDVFSYPYGSADQRCIELCRKYFKFGFTTVRQGCFDWQSEPATIRRIYISPQDRPDDVQRKINGYLKGIQHD